MNWRAWTPPGTTREPTFSPSWPGAVSVRPPSSSSGWRTKPLTAGPDSSASSTGPSTVRARGTRTRPIPVSLSLPPSSSLVVLRAGSWPTAKPSRGTKARAWPNSSPTSSPPSPASCSVLSALSLPQLGCPLSHVVLDRRMAHSLRFGLPGPGPVYRMLLQHRRRQARLARGQMGRLGRHEGPDLGGLERRQARTEWERTS